MNKQEFLQQLEQELASLPNDERISALQYFTMYFEDAGPEHEAEVIADLGSPQKIAADIKSSSGYDFSESWTPPEKPTTPELTFENTNTAPTNIPTEPEPEPIPSPAQGQEQESFKDFTQRQPNVLPPNSSYGQKNNYNENTTTYTNAPPTQNNNTLKIILLIVLSPIWLGLAGAAIGIFIALVTVLFVPCIVGFSLAASSILVFVLGSMTFAISVPNALLTFGLGLILLGIGLVLLWVGAFLVKTVIPLIFKGLRSLFYTIFPRKAVA